MKVTSTMRNLYEEGKSVESSEDVDDVYQDVKKEVEEIDDEEQQLAFIISPFLSMQKGDEDLSPFLEMREEYFEKQCPVSEGTIGDWVVQQLTSHTADFFQELEEELEGNEG